MSVDEILIYLSNGIESFSADPATTNFQKGYKAALEELEGWILDGIAPLEDDAQPEDGAPY